MVFIEDSSGNFIITKITDGGEVSKTSLKVGDKICCINKIFPATLKEVNDILFQAIGRIDISVDRLLEKVSCDD